MDFQKAQMKCFFLKDKILKEKLDKPVVSQHIFLTPHPHTEQYILCFMFYFLCFICFMLLLSILHLIITK